MIDAFICHGVSCVAQIPHFMLTILRIFLFRYVLFVDIRVMNLCLEILPILIFDSFVELFVGVIGFRYFLDDFELF